jgi:hypothetical protein
VLFLRVASFMGSLFLFRRPRESADAEPQGSSL